MDRWPSFSAFALCIGALFLASCGDSADDPAASEPDPALVGEWSGLVLFDDPNLAGLTEIRIDLAGDGTFELNFDNWVPDCPMNGTWGVSTGTFSARAEVSCRADSFVLTAPRSSSRLQGQIELGTDVGEFNVTR